MKAAFYEAFGGPVTVGRLDDPVPAADGVLIAVEASGNHRF